MSRDASIASIDDYEEIVAIAETFVEGLRDGDPDLMMAAFHDAAVAFGISEGELTAGPARDLHGVITELGAAPGLRSHIDVLAVTPTTAIVRVEIEKDALGKDYTDFYAMLKQDGAWRIVANVMHQYA